MTRYELIGRVVARYLHANLPREESASTARYLLDRLTVEQTVGIARAILADATLTAKIEIKLPRHWVGSHGLPADCLTDERATYFRNSPSEKPVLLIATRGDDERVSLADLTPIDSIQMRAHSVLWIEVAAHHLALTEQQRRWWEVALSALQDVSSLSLDAFADYILRTREEVEDGHVLPEALGIALPALKWPRHPALFRALGDKALGQPSKWRSLYAHVGRKLACYLKKKNPKDQTLSSDELTASFAKVRDDIPEELHPRIEAFIAAPPKWNPEAEALAQVDWEVIAPLFDGLAREAFNLGRETLRFYDERKPDIELSDAETEYLNGLATRGRSTQPLDDDFDFYHRRRNELKEHPPLKSRWDRFIFGSPVETTDFLLGLGLCLESLFDQNILGVKRQLVISTERKAKKDLRNLNVSAGRYFAFRYRGIKELFPAGTFDVGSLFDFDSLLAEWVKESRYKANTSTARKSVEIKFYVSLEIDGDEAAHRQLIWRFAPESIASELHADWIDRLIDHPFLEGTVERQAVASKGGIQVLDLRNVKSLGARPGQNRGSLLPGYRKERDLRLQWLANLSAAREGGFISPEVADRLQSKFDAFANAYTAAIAGFPKMGSTCSEIAVQFAAFAELLDVICRQAKGDRNRDLLLRPLLRVGVIPVLGGAPAAIVAPWHPLRMQAIAIKAQRLADLIEYLLTAENVLFGDAKLFFKELRDEQQHPHYPEIIVGWRDRKPELLGLSDSLLDYSLHELPIADDSNGADTNENPLESSTQIVDMIRRYLALFPHERSNLAAVLYNCDSASLPQAVVAKINELHDDEDEVRCEVILRHRDRQRLHALYERITELAEGDADAFVASEASQDFMARLRIGIMADQAPVPEPEDGPQADLVFLHDVISRHSHLEWYRESAAPHPLADLIPSRWSRRRPSPVDEEKSIVYLCCPVQSAEGWAYITAVTTFFKGDWDEEITRRYLPARQLDFNDPETSDIFQESHNLGNWVVNYDELLDRRQLINQQVRIIRYKQSATQGRNLLVSSKTDLGLLRSMLFNRIKDLCPEFSDDRARELAHRFISDANAISGDIVLRAAKRGRNASELMGIVLSSYLVAHELGQSKKTGWYFLDDYSEWLGQKEEQIADLLVLQPEMVEGTMRLTVVVTEAKYILESSLTDDRRDSQQQLRDTIRRIRDALFGAPERLDRMLWLSRFSDLLLSGIPYRAADALSLMDFRRALREGACQINVRGYSHVFVSGPSDASDFFDFVEVADCENSFQEVYCRAKTRGLLQAYADQASPDNLRGSVVENDLVRRRDFAPPTQIARIPTPVASPSTPPPPIVSTTPPRSVDASAMSSWLNPQLAALIAEGVRQSAPPAAETEWQAQTVTRMRSALQQFQLNSKLLSCILTPNALLMKFQGASNLTVDQVLKKRSEFLTTHGLNIISVRPEPGAVSIAVARPERQVLRLWDVWSRWQPDTTRGNIKLLIAVQEENSEPLFISPSEHAPHTLVAGATGSGKSVLMQNILLAIACTNTPAQSRIVLIDPKRGVDYFPFSELPHLDGGIIDEQNAAIQKLNQLVQEMDRRYEILRANRVADIYRLNAKADATEHLPYLWIFHDEFAEWMMTDTYRDAVSNVVSRLGVKARAAGIYLFFAAQRPDADVMPMQLRANLGNRLVLRVDGEGTSEISLGERNGGAERLLGRGHLAAKLVNVPSIVFAQVPLISDDEIQQIVSALRS